MEVHSDFDLKSHFARRMNDDLSVNVTDAHFHCCVVTVELVLVHVLDIGHSRIDRETQACRWMID